MMKKLIPLNFFSTSIFLFYFKILQLLPILCSSSLWFFYFNMYHFHFPKHQAIYHNIKKINKFQQKHEAHFFLQEIFLFLSTRRENPVALSANICINKYINHITVRNRPNCSGIPYDREKKTHDFED